MTDVLVTNQDHKNALAALRSLGKKGYNLTGAGQSRWDHGLFSKYADKKLVYPSPESDSAGFRDTLLDYVAREGIDVVLPIGVDVVTVVALNHKEFSEVTGVPFGDYGIFEKAHDKSNTMRIAQKNGIPMPKTRFPNSIKDYEGMLDSLDYPHVLKARRGSAYSGVSIVRWKGEALEKYNELSSRKSGFNAIYDFEKPIIQEFVPGDIYDVCVLCDRGDLRRALTQVRVKTWPTAGGAGVVNKTTDNPELIEPTRKLLEKVGWHGVAQVEYKMDAEGNPRLMEINPKFWGTLDLSIQAGMDFPDLACRLALGEEIGENYEYRKGLKYRWIWPYEIMHLFSEFSPGEIRSFLDFRGPTSYDIWLSDIVPDLIRIQNVAAKYLRNRRRRK